MKQGLRLFLLYLTLAVMTSCISVTAIPLGSTKYPPNTTTQLPLYNSVPEGNWVEVVRLRIGGSSFHKTDDILQEAQVEAAKYGAHALVILNEGVNREHHHEASTSSANTHNKPFGVFVGIRNLDY